MTMFIKLENGQPIGNAVSQANLEYLFPNFNFNQILTPAMVEPLGYGMYEFTQIPTAQRYEKIVEGTAIRNADNGIYYQNWQAQTMTAEEQQETDLRRADLMRAERNARLTATDWTQLGDAPLTSEKRAEYAVHRQALRDITSAAGFPWNITWPTKPA
jgi:hypothetical protein